MAVPEGLVRFIPPGQEEIQNFISSAANQSVRPYNTNEEYLYAMKEDLAEWLKELYEVDIHVNNFMEFLDDGILLCEHANCVNDQANRFREAHVGDPILRKIILPSKRVRYTPGRHASSFFARDNVANFINWCRKELLIGEAVMFESNDLILRKNEKNFILCLLEMARRGSKFGVPAPVLIQMEEDIDKEIEQDLRDEKSQEQSDDTEEEIVEEPVREPPKQKVACDFKSLDEMVQYILGMCTCPTQFPMVKVSEGKYKVGDSKTLIFMRILRNHVMVRVGGGWDTLEHYLDKHDPCRCNRHKVEQKIAARFKCSTEDYFEKLLGNLLSSQVGPRLSVKQANDIMDKAGTSAKTSKDWSHIRTQSLPAYEDKMSTPSTSRSSKFASQSSEPVHRVTKSFDNSQPSSPKEPVTSMQVEITTSRKSTLRNSENTRPFSATNRDTKSSTLPRSHKTPEIRITKSSNADSLNQTYPITSRPTRTSTLRASKFDQSTTDKNTTPRPNSLRSASTGSMSHTRDYRQSVTPTPTSTSQKRAALSVARSKTPDPQKMTQSTIESKRTSRMKGPPSAYRKFETLPRDQRMNEKAPARSDARLSTGNRQSSTPDRRYNSLPRPSSAMSYRSPSDEKESEKRPTLSVAKGLSHHGSMPDVRQPPRPKSALGNPTLSTVPRSNTVRKTIANTAHNPTMQRLTAKARSQSMDNLSIQKQLNSSTAEIQRNQFFDRLSQPKSSSTRRSRTNLVDENVLFVERQGEGRHSVQRNASTPRSPKQNTDKKASSGDSSSFRLSVNMSGAPDSPNSRVSYSWGEEASVDESGVQPHTPKIINRQQQPESHLKAPPKEKVSKEEVLYVVRNNDGRHQWEHTETSLEKSQEYTELSPYKQMSPRSTTSERPRASSLRNASSSSESSVMSPVGRMRPSAAGIPSPGFNRDESLREYRSTKSKYPIGSPSASSVASSKSSGDARRRKPNISDQVRSMLFTDDGKARPPSANTRTGSNMTSTPRPSSARPRPSTPRRDLTGQTRTQSRPLTPKATTSNRLSTVKPRAKTPDARRSTLTRQEKLKSYDGPSSRIEPKQAESLDKESRMLMEFEKEYLENQRILSQSGDESGSIDQGSVDNDGNYWEYDYNGRRVRKNRTRNKPTASLRSKSTPRMERMSSYDSELTDRSFDCGTSIANSEDFEVAMAMSNGMKQQNPASSSIRSRSVDNFLDERGPRPRKDKHDSRKSRIPTPVHFNSGRKSATGVLYHDSTASKSAIRSNVEGVSSVEMDTMNRKSVHSTNKSTTSNMGKHTQYQTSKKRIDPRDGAHSGPAYHHKENIRPSRSQRSNAEEYNIDNTECFTFGRHGNQKVKSSGNTNHLVNKNEMNFARYKSSNENNNVLSEQGIEESPEPIPPPRKKGGYYRKQLHSSPADLLQANQPMGLATGYVNRPVHPNLPYQGTQSDKQQQSALPIHDRNDSGFEPGSDPNSPLSPYAGAQMNGRLSSRVRSSAEEGKKEIDESGPMQASPEHGVRNTPTGKYYFVMPGQHNPRLHTGYDAPRQQATPTRITQDNWKGQPRQNSSRNDSAIAQSPSESFELNQSPSLVNKPGQAYRLSYEEASNHRSPLSPNGKNTLQASSNYTTPNGSSTPQNLQAQYQSQHEANQRDSLQSGISENEGSMFSKTSKRRQFNEFFNDNQKLKETLNRLDQFCNDENTTGSAFQYEELPDDTQGPISTDYSGNPFSFDSTDGNAYPLKEDARKSHEIGVDTNGREYPSLDGRRFYNDIPARPSQYKAFEKHRFDPQTGNYKEIRDKADQRLFASGPQKSGRKEEYV